MTVRRPEDWWQNWTYQRINRLASPLEYRGWIGSPTRTTERQRMFDVSEVKPEWDGLDSYGESVSGRMLRLELVVRRPSTRTKRRSVDVVRERGVRWCERKRCRRKGTTEADDWLRPTLEASSPEEEGEDSASLSIFT